MSGCLLVAEFLTNAFKYAYPAGVAGKIAVRFKRHGDGWTLDVEDHGRELPDGFDIQKSTGVGMKAITALAQRLDADVNFSLRPGETVFTVTCAAL